MEEFYAVMVKSANSLIKNKKAAILDYFIIIGTLMGCFIVVINMHTSTDLSIKMISPIYVLELDDLRILFEREESFLLKRVYCENKNAEMMKNSFCSSFDHFRHKAFLLENTFFTEFRMGEFDFCQRVYSFQKQGDNLIVKRSGLAKEKFLTSKDEKGFNVFFRFDLEKKYLLTPDDC